MTDDLHLFTEDGTEYVLPADFFAGPLKPGTRGTWGDYWWQRGTVAAGVPDCDDDIVVLDEINCYHIIALIDFIPEVKPEPPTTVMVPMRADVARWIIENADDDTATAAAEALKKAGLK